MEKYKIAYYKIILNRQCSCYLITGLIFMGLLIIALAIFDTLNNNIK